MVVVGFNELKYLIGSGVVLELVIMVIYLFCVFVKCCFKVVEIVEIKEKLLIRMLFIGRIEIVIKGVVMGDLWGCLLVWYLGEEDMFVVYRLNSDGLI